MFRNRLVIGIGKHLLMLSKGKFNKCASEMAYRLFTLSIKENIKADGVSGVKAIMHH